VVSLLGSNGTRAVAIALLGAAMVTVVDVSPANAAWGTALAAAAGTGAAVRYVVGDALELSSEQEAAAGGADVAVAELGVRRC
jgi:23S rRNA G2069 N7-methylase RlmK/C1962 C5-methylase RlmI